MRKKMSNFLYAIRSKIPRHFTQVLATLAVSLGPFSAGLGKGYSSPALASLQESKSSTFAVSPQEESWVASLSLLGALFGCLVGGFMLQLGRKMSLVIVALPFSCSWLLTVFAQRVEMIYSTSFIGGFFSAVTLLATQVYVSEISHPEIRGCLSSVLKIFGYLGHLCSFTLGAFLDWRQLAAVAACAPVLFFFAILFIPETPSFLLFHGRDEEASKAMTWLRSNDDDVASEIETLRGNIKGKQKRLIPKCSAQFTHLLLITCGLMFFHKFSGVTVFNHYAVSIFQQVYNRSCNTSSPSTEIIIDADDFSFNNLTSNSDYQVSFGSHESSVMVFGRSLNPHGAAIIVVFLQLLGSMTSGLLIDTAGRLPLLTVSSLFISASCFGFGLYNYMEASLPPWSPGFGPSLGWIPLTCVLIFTLFFSIGIGPISWLLVGELFPLEYRELGGAISTAFSYACAFTAVKTYVDITSHVGLHGAFWIYSAVSIVGLFFISCIVPETKGLELEEMHHATSVPTTIHTSSTPPATLLRKHHDHSHRNQSNHVPHLNLNPMENHILTVKHQQPPDKKLMSSSSSSLTNPTSKKKLHHILSTSNSTTPNIIANLKNICNNSPVTNLRNSLVPNNAKIASNAINNLNASPSMLTKLQHHVSPSQEEHPLYQQHTRIPTSDLHMYSDRNLRNSPPQYSLPTNLFAHHLEYQSNPPYLYPDQEHHRLTNNYSNFYEYEDDDDNDTITTNDIDRYDKFVIDHYDSMYDDEHGGDNELVNGVYETPSLEELRRERQLQEYEDEYEEEQEYLRQKKKHNNVHSNSSLLASNQNYNPNPLYQYSYKQPEEHAVVNALPNSSTNYIHHDDLYSGLHAANATNV